MSPGIGTRSQKLAEACAAGSFQPWRKFFGRSGGPGLVAATTEGPRGTVCWTNMARALGLGPGSLTRSPWRLQPTYLPGLLQGHHPAQGSCRLSLWRGHHRSHLSGRAPYPEDCATPSTAGSPPHPPLGALGAGLRSRGTAPPARPGPCLAPRGPELTENWPPGTPLTPGWHAGLGRCRCCDRAPPTPDLGLPAGGRGWAAPFCGGLPWPRTQLDKGWHLLTPRRGPRRGQQLLQRCLQVLLPQATATHGLEKQGHGGSPTLRARLPCLHPGSPSSGREVAGGPNGCPVGPARPETPLQSPGAGWRSVPPQQAPVLRKPKALTTTDPQTLHLPGASATPGPPLPRLGVSPIPHCRVPALQARRPRLGRTKHQPGTRWGPRAECPPRAASTLALNSQAQAPQDGLELPPAAPARWRLETTSGPTPLGRKAVWARDQKSHRRSSSRPSSRRTTAPRAPPADSPGWTPAASLRHAAGQRPPACSARRHAARPGHDSSAYCELPSADGEAEAPSQAHADCRAGPPRAVDSAWEGQTESGPRDVLAGEERQ